MDFTGLIAHLGTTEEGKAFLTDLNAHIETIDKTKTELDDAKNKLNLLGDRDIAQSVALLDLLKKEGLDTAAGIVDLKNSAAEADKKLTTAKEIAAATEAKQKEINEGADAITAKANALLQRSQIHTSLAKFAGESDSLFRRVVDGGIEDKEFTLSEDGKTLYKGEIIDTAIEKMRTDYPNTFRPAPQGTGNPPAPNNPTTPEPTKGKATFSDVVAEMNKN